MEIVPQFDRNHIIRCQANAAGIRKARKGEQLGIELTEVEANIGILQTHDSLRTLPGRLTRSGLEGLMNIVNAAEPGEGAARRPFQIPSITGHKGGAKVQILLAAVQKIGQAHNEGISVQKPGEYRL